MKTSISIIGSGFSSLAAASYLAHAGFEVTIYEKNATVGGRARHGRDKKLQQEMKTRNRLWKL
ncbi:MAG: NAD(P)-binding protein, partial [Bacteroidota bacterium]